LLAACATPYQQSGLSGGFTDLPMGNNTYSIRFSGNGFTSGERATSMAYIRAADLAISKGYQRFVVLGLDEDIKVSTYTTAGSSSTTVTGTANTTASATGYSVGSSAYAYGNAYTNYNAKADTTFTPPQTHYINKPSTALVVRFVSPDSPDFEQAIDAYDVLNSLGPKYGMKDIPQRQ